MGLLVNLELLHLKTEQFSPEDLRVLEACRLWKIFS
jgi:hypothetical protein